MEKAAAEFRPTKMVDAHAGLTRRVLDIERSQLTELGLAEMKALKFGFPSLEHGLIHVLDACFQVDDSLFWSLAIVRVANLIGHLLGRSDKVEVVELPVVCSKVQPLGRGGVTALSHVVVKQLLPLAVVLQSLEAFATACDHFGVQPECIADHLVRRA